MTDDKDLKRLVRQRMAKTGESYTAARAHFRLAPPAPSDASVDAFRRRVFGRSGLDGLGRHLEDCYGIAVRKLTELDLGVLRVDRKDGPAWVARVFSSSRPIGAVEHDAAVLRHLAEHGIPAERLAHDEPVSALEGQGVLVTEHIAGLNARFDTSGETMWQLGDALGRVHALPLGPGAPAGSAGGWHHLSISGGSRRTDIDALSPMLAVAAAAAPPEEHEALATLQETLRAVDDLGDLPHSLIHPNPAGANAVVTAAGDAVLIDWTGAGRGPRVLSLAALVGASVHPHPGVAPNRELRPVDAVIAGYREHVVLDDAELERLAAAIVGESVLLNCWSLLFQGLAPSQVLAALAAVAPMSEAIGQRVREAFAAEADELTAWFRPTPSPVHPGQGTLL